MALTRSQKSASTDSLRLHIGQILLQALLTHRITRLRAKGLTEPCRGLTILFKGRPINSTLKVTGNSSRGLNRPPTVKNNSI